MAGMSNTIPTTEPARLTAGETWKWQKSLPDYPSPTWVLTYQFRPRSGGSGFSITASQYGSTSDHLVNVPYATSATRTAGDYVWQSFVASSTERFRVDQGSLAIDPDYASSSADPRSHVEKVYDALKAVVEGKADKDILSTTINGKTLQRMAWEEILTAYNHFKRLALQEAVARANAEDASAVSEGRQIRYTMGNP